MPEPVPVATVTVYAVPMPLTWVTTAPVTPAPGTTTAKFNFDSPVTACEKATLNVTDSAKVGFWAP